MNVPALDGNIKRVYARVFDISEPVDSPQGEKLLMGTGGEGSCPKGCRRLQPGAHGPGLNDLHPKESTLFDLPGDEICKARQNGTQDQRPVKTPKKNVPHHVHAAGVIVRRIGNPPHTLVLLAKRPSKGLLGGMWEFPNGRVSGDPREGWRRH
jgi:A/G-specific adenine glycosylase